MAAASSRPSRAAAGRPSPSCGAATAIRRATLPKASVRVARPIMSARPTPARRICEQPSRARATSRCRRFAHREHRRFGGRLCDDRLDGRPAARPRRGDQLCRRRGSLVSDHVCDPDALVAAFSTLGKRSRLPMLWVFAQNDHYYPLPLAQQLRQAFVASGGMVDFVVTRPSARMGTIFSCRPHADLAAHRRPILDRHGLKLVAEPLPETPPPSLNPPSQLDPKGRDAFARYLAAPPHKALRSPPTAPMAGAAAAAARTSAPRRHGKLRPIATRSTAASYPWTAHGLPEGTNNNGWSRTAGRVLLPLREKVACEA